MKKGDVIIIVSVIILALIGGLYYYLTLDHEEEGAIIVVEVNGEEVGRFPLFEEGRDKIVIFTGPVGETEVQFLETGARVLRSDCPDKICIRSGVMDRPGHSNACLPNRVVFRIVGGNETDINLR